MNKLKQIWSNKWVKFTIVSILYILLFVVWTGNLWMLPGLLLIFDIYISKILYRLFWRSHQELKARNKSYKKTMEWVEAIVFAVVVVTFIHYFLFAMFVIPSPSMEKSLLVGDYLCVSKLSYGPAVPRTPVSFPLVHNTMPMSKTEKSYKEWIKWPYHRLKGLGHVQRGDVVVFNFPAGDTVALERSNETYYDILRAYQKQLGERAGRAQLFKDYTIVARPVDKRDNYVKRCVGIPGDSLVVVEGRLIVNGQPFEPIPKMQFDYHVYTNGTPISQDVFRDMGVAMSDISYNHYAKSYSLPLSEDNLRRVEAMSNVTSVERAQPVGVNPMIFPHDAGRYPWNEDNFGPVWVPRKGETVPLTLDNLPLYAKIIDTYEGGKLEVRGNEIFIDGELTDSYTFKMDYFFMMGDNRHRSADSRFWGFVPEDHVVGKAVFTWMSLDRERGFPGNIRWNRIFRKIR